MKDVADRAVVAGRAALNNDRTDYLAEARNILAGTTLLLPRREHLLALNAYYVDALLRVNESVEAAWVLTEKLQTLAREQDELLATTHGAQMRQPASEGL